MRFIKDYPHKDIKISLYHWNLKYIIKCETKYLEQTYKFDEMDIYDEQMLDDLVASETFLDNVEQNFIQMSKSYKVFLHDIDEL